MIGLLLGASMLVSIVSIFGDVFTLTLSGIVGTIVSIGVSLDSSIVYFENLKEDVRRGRTIRSVAETSFDGAFSTIAKANSSSFIAAVVLYVLSVGPVRGFALYLGLSTILDLVLTYFFVRPATILVARSKMGNKPGWFGIDVDAPLKPIGGRRSRSAEPGVGGALATDGGTN
jgi:preprotein translocase subunit SecD